MTDDERVALALAALAEVTDPGSIGPLVDASVPEPGVVDLRFASAHRGYAGWFWTVSTSAVEGFEPTVIELELLPGDGALVAPSWVPWEERLADWRRAHGDAAVEGLGDDEPDDDDDDDEDEDELDDEEDLDDPYAVDDLDDGADVDGDRDAEDEPVGDVAGAGDGSAANDLDRAVDEVLDDGDRAGVDVDVSDASGAVGVEEHAAPRRRRRRAQRP